MPIHLIRYEDIVSYPKQALSGLMKFLLNKQDISGSKIEHFIKLAVQEASP